MFKNLQAEMARNDVTQERLSKILEISPKTVSNKMAGKTEWTLSEITKIIKLFPCQISFDYLFAEEAS